MLRFLFFLVLSSLATAAEPAKPNIIFILADDMGYGDIRCLNPKGKIATPHLDRLRNEGMAFTDAHSSSAVCTPTRYGILTGRYNWRSRLKKGVLGGMSPVLIEDGRLTVPAFLKQHGYNTACIGKWHLGLNWKLKENEKSFGDGIENGKAGWNVDFTKPFTGGPTALGFDSFYGIAASLDMVPYTYLENDRVTVVPTTDKDFPMMLNAKDGRTRKGPAAENFDATDVLPTLTKRAIEFVKSQNADRPFFLYLPLASPHTPIVPSKEWQGKSGLNHYADFVMETDDSVGRILDALIAQKLDANTLFIFTSDNGCSPQANLPALAAQGHDPNAERRGHKADIFEGGHRVPFIARWPAKIKPQSTSAQTICLTDLFSTAAAMVNAKVPETAAEDSFSLLPAFEGATTAIREATVHHSINGSFAIRQGKWKLQLCPDSGGWSAPRPNSPEGKSLPPTQLYDLENDPAETKNLASEKPEVVEQLTKLLETYVERGRSTPGAPQQNTGTVTIRRG